MEGEKLVLSGVSNRKALFETCEWDKYEDMLRMVLRHLPNIPDSGFKLAQKACLDFLDRKGKIRLKITYNNAISQLKKFSRNANKLLFTLNEMDTDVFDDMNFASFHLKEFKVNEYYSFDIDNWIEMLEALVWLADNPNEWLDIIAGAKRPTERTYLRDAFIRAMATVFEGEKAMPALAGVKSDNEHNNQGGEFYDLIWDCLVAGGYKPESGVEIENAIRKKLKTRPPRTTPWPA